MRITGPAFKPTEGAIDGKPSESIQRAKKITTATTNQIKITQQRTCPAGVVMSDVRFLTVITSTNAAVMKSKMNSYMYERRIFELYSYCPSNVSSKLDMKFSVIC